MEKENATLLTEFILTGLIYQPEWQIPLFLLFLMIYLITIMGNLGLIALICNDPHLHIPMYLFLENLALVDAWISSTVTPQLLVSFFAKSKMMSLTECKIQFVFLWNQNNHWMLFAGNSSIWLLCGHCKPLLYPVIMTNRLCIQLLVSSFLGGLFHAILHNITFIKIDLL